MSGMTDAQIHQWIDACNHEPARQVLRDFLRLRGEAQGEQQAAAWRGPDELPDVARGEYSHFWVAIRRNERVVSYPAVYLNAMQLDRDDFDPIENAETGNRWRNDPPGEDDECCMLATGWHDSREHSEYDGYYSHLLEEGAELLGWREVAPWPAGDHTQPAAPSPSADLEVSNG